MHNWHPCNVQPFMRLHVIPLLLLHFNATVGPTLGGLLSVCRLHRILVCLIVEFLLRSVFFCCVRSKRTEQTYGAGSPGQEQQRDQSAPGPSFPAVLFTPAITTACPSPSA